ncbi:MAG: thioredoxin domain-containing protein [Candidatus Binatia bacterium]
MRSPRFAVPVLTFFCLALAGCGSLPGFGKKDVAAEIGSKKITVEEIDAQIKSELTRIEGERYEARKKQLDQMIDDALIEQQAKSLGISKDDLLKREVTDKAKLPSDEDIKATYEKFKGQLGAFDAVAPRIKDMLGMQATNARRAEFASELRKEAKVSVKLSPPRHVIDTAGGHFSGPADAPIKFIEFSDYQCPFCARSQATVGQVLDKYDGKVLHIFMDFPLSQIHPMAQPASVAARCAEEQGKFAEYHKLLFEHQRELSQDNFKKWAGELSLDRAKFDACMASKKFDETISRQLKAGQAAGINGTPGFFVNGIAIKGAQPLEAFQRVIDDELARGK